MIFLNYGESEPDLCADLCDPDLMLSVSVILISEIDCGGVVCKQ